jgi:hypothetical protein
MAAKCNTTLVDQLSMCCGNYIRLVVVTVTDL